MLADSMLDFSVTSLVMTSAFVVIEFCKNGTYRREKN